MIPNPLEAAAIDAEFRRLHERVERQRALAEETGDDYGYRKALGVARSWLAITIFGGTSFKDAHARYMNDPVFHMQVDVLVQMLTLLDGPVPPTPPSPEQIAELMKKGTLGTTPDVDL